MGQTVCHFWFCHYRQQMPHLWMSATNCHLDDPGCKAKNRGHSIDPHIQNGAVTVSLSLFPIKAANTLIMHNSEQLTFYLPYLQDQKSWTLCWHSVYCIIHLKCAAIDNCIHNHIKFLIFFLTDWDLALSHSQAKEYSCTGRSHSIEIYLYR